jgi:arylsulfatase
MQVKLRCTKAALMGAVLLTLTAAVVMAAEIAGTLASPSATITLDGKPPPAPTHFGGVIKENATDSKSWRPPRVKGGRRSLWPDEARND